MGIIETQNKSIFVARCYNWMSFCYTQMMSAIDNKINSKCITYFLRPEEWLMRSHSLACSASAIYENINRHRKEKWQNLSYLESAPVMIMLCAYSIENYLKAGVRANILSIDLCKNDKKNIFHHNLLGLLKETGLRVTKKRKNILKKLQGYTQWEVRYSTPKSIKDFIGPVHVIGITENDIDNIYFPLWFDCHKLKESIRAPIYKKCQKWSRAFPLPKDAAPFKIELN